MCQGKKCLSRPLNKFFLIGLEAVLPTVYRPLSLMQLLRQHRLFLTEPKAAHNPAASWKMFLPLPSPLDRQVVALFS